MEIARITITQELDEDDVVVGVQLDPDDTQLVTALGLIELARDTLLHPPPDGDG